MTGPGRPAARNPIDPTSKKFDGLLAPERRGCLKRLTERVDPCGMGNGRGRRTNAPGGHYRTLAEVAGFVDDVIVRVLHLAPDRAGLLSPRAFEPGRALDLVAELPLGNGATHATRLHLNVVACRPEPEPARGWRIGGTVVPCEAADRDALLEYCRTVTARNGQSAGGRRQPTDAPGQGPGDELGFEELWLAVAGEAEA